MSNQAPAATADTSRIEAPVTWKAYLICMFASTGGLLFGYDSGYINGVIGNPIFIREVEGPSATSLTGSHQSLIVSILSAGTFFGALLAGDVADMLGRKWTIVAGGGIYILGCVLQAAMNGIGLIVTGRLIAGIGVGFDSATIILYMSEISPRKIRGALVSAYAWCVTIGLLLAACINYACKDRRDSGAYRIPISIQIICGLLLVGGLMWLPDSPRFYVKHGRTQKARKALSRLRGQPIDADCIEVELAEIVANEEYERSLLPPGGWLSSWLNCFRGSLSKSSSNLRKTILGTSIQMMQQWTGINFIFYYSTSFLQSTGAIENTFLMSLIFTLVNVCSTPIAFVAVEKLGRRAVLLWGAVGMTICQLLVAVLGVTVGFNHTHEDAEGKTVAKSISAVNAQIAFVAMYIFFFACSWGGVAWVVIGEIFPLPIRSRGVGLSTASNWLWNTIIALITPYMVNEDEGNLKSHVFWVWGGFCACIIVYVYLLVPETKGLTLEQVDKMMEETTPRTSARWKPTTTFAVDQRMKLEKDHEKCSVHVEDAA